MDLAQALKLLDAAVTAVVLGLWLRYEIKSKRRLQKHLKQCRERYRSDMGDALDTLEAQAESRSRQQAQLEAILQQLLKLDIPLDGDDDRDS